MVVMGENPKCKKEIMLVFLFIFRKVILQKAVEEKMPIIVVRGSNFSDNLIHMLKFPENDY